METAVSGAIRCLFLVHRIKNRSSLRPSVTLWRCTHSSIRLNGIRPVEPRLIHRLGLRCNRPCPAEGGEVFVRSGPSLPVLVVRQLLYGSIGGVETVTASSVEVVRNLAQEKAEWAREEKGGGNTQEEQRGEGEAERGCEE